jgi:hypothetical protein
VGRTCLDHVAFRRRLVMLVVRRQLNARTKLAACMCSVCGLAAVALVCHILHLKSELRTELRQELAKKDIQFDESLFHPQRRLIVFDHGMILEWYAYSYYFYQFDEGYGITEYYVRRGIIRVKNPFYREP